MPPSTATTATDPDCTRPGWVVVGRAIVVEGAAAGVVNVGRGAALFNKPIKADDVDHAGRADRPL